jgi:hypothetical protein
MEKYKNHIVVIVFYLFILAFAAYAWRGLAFYGWHDHLLFNLVFWLVPVAYILIFSAIFIFKPKNISPEGFKKVMLFFAAFLAYIIPVIFFDVFVLLADLGLLITWPIAGIETANRVAQIILVLGGAVYLFLLIAVLKGIFHGRFDFRVNRHSLRFPNLPGSFDGLKVVQISDFHIGCFIGNMKQVQKGIDLVNKEEPDIILFTGDLITVHAD